MKRHEELVTIGHAGVEVTRLGLGTAPLGGMYQPVTDEDARDVVTTAYSSGIRYFDTAPLYGHGVAERRLGMGLAAGTGPGVVLSTKVGRVLVTGQDRDAGIYVDAGPEQPVFDYSAEGVRASLESSLERLGVDSIDLVLIHDPDDHEEEALRWAYPELARLRSEGVVRAIGLGMNQTRIPTRFVRETDIDAVLVAGRFTLLDQQAQHELLPAALGRGVSVIAAGVFNSGILVDPRPGSTYDYAAAPAGLIERAKAVRSVLAEFEVPLTAAALQFPLRHPAVSVVLTGARHPREVLANIDDFDRDVPESCWHALEERGLIEAISG